MLEVKAKVEVWTKTKHPNPNLPTHFHLKDFSLQFD